ncbi:hypothetical protein [Crocosphaera sp.]|uniref:hypothetical protein n=1 Tax=Crocosphaera sp. TaxID=2729996 RepID=UPI0026385891|nr:hypothetical protein [Crocosphaera sp.]MDJ0579624.1 hypothetical protein [Crocosphaera sp.]
MKSTTESQTQWSKDRNYHHKKRGKILITNLLVAGVIILICFFFFWQTGLLVSGLNFFMNDHTIVTMHQEVQELGLWPTIKQWVIRDHSMGRFVPLYYTNQVLLSQLLGINGNVWFTFSCLLLSLTAFAMVWFARLLNIPLLIACIFPALALLGPQASIWTQPSYTQVTGTFFLAVAMVFAVLLAKTKNNSQALIFNILFVLSTLCASLIKESYIICIPALIALRIWSYSYLNHTSLYESIAKTLKTNIIVIGILIAELYYIFFVIGSDGMNYAGIDQQTFQLSKIFSTALDLFNSSHLWIFPVSFLATIIIIIYQKKSIQGFIKQLLPAVIISLLIMGPQILLYTKSGILGMLGYYLIPATIGSAFLITYSIELLRVYSKIIAYIFIGISIAVITSSIPKVWTVYSNIAYNNFNINQLFQEIVQCTPNNEPILFAVNPRVRYEAASVTPKILDYVYNRQNLFIATYGLKDTEFFSDTLQEAENYLTYLVPQAVINQYDGRTITSFDKKQDISTVVVFDGLDNDFLETSNSWFQLDDYEKTEFPIPLAPANLYCKSFTSNLN